MYLKINEHKGISRGEWNQHTAIDSLDPSELSILWQLRAVPWGKKGWLDEAGSREGDDRPGDGFQRLQSEAAEVRATCLSFPILLRSSPKRDASKGPEAHLQVTSFPVLQQQSLNQQRPLLARGFWASFLTTFWKLLSGPSHP